MSRLRDQTESPDPRVAEAARKLATLRPREPDPEAFVRASQALERRRLHRGPSRRWVLQAALVLALMALAAAASALVTRHLVIRSLTRGLHGEADRPERAPSPPTTSPLPPPAAPPAPTTAVTRGGPSAALHGDPTVAPHDQPTAADHGGPTVAPVGAAAPGRTTSKGSATPRVMGSDAPAATGAPAPSGSAVPVPDEVPDETPALPPVADPPVPAAEDPTAIGQRVRRGEAGSELLVTAVRKLRQEGDPARALILLDEYLATHHTGPLVEEAMAAAAEAAVMAHDPSAAARVDGYIARFPSGRYPAVRKLRQSLGR